MAQNQNDKCYASAMRLLVRREHSTLELRQKLAAKGFDIELIDFSICKLIEHNQQSDKRFAEDFIRMRFNQGKGPVKISLELKQKGIQSFSFSGFDFFSLANKVRQKKFGTKIPNNYNDEAKQKRFLQSRGFNFDQIDSAFTK
ncbi:MAG: regulatory protein RecX [PS1 clade bacterium]